jgi:AmmeMemoRadiSam system protein A
MLSENSREILVNIVKDALKCALTADEYKLPESIPDELKKECGCFVTLKTSGHLRGCLGRFVSDLPLCETVAIMTKESALEDPRFAANRLTMDNYENITFDVSVLSPLEKCTEPEKITLGVHGIYIRKGWTSGCFLPQVATETGWTIEEFWSHCCAHKAGLSPDAWKGDDIELFTFTAEVIEADCK